MKRKIISDSENLCNKIIYQLMEKILSEMKMENKCNQIIKKEYLDIGIKSSLKE